MRKLAIKELKEKLNYTDLRAIRTWCKKNEVLIIKHGKCEFVFETNFEEAYEKPFINKLKSCFGKEWESVYSLYKDGNIPALNILNDLSTKPISIYNKPQNKESKFLKKLKEYENKKKNAA